MELFELDNCTSPLATDGPATEQGEENGSYTPSEDGAAALASSSLLCSAKLEFLYGFVNVGSVVCGLFSAPKCFKRSLEAVLVSGRLAFMPSVAASWPSISSLPQLCKRGNKGGDSEGNSDIYSRKF